MHSLTSLSFILTLSSLVNALIFPFDIRSAGKPSSSNLVRRANSTIPITNNGNAEYYANITLAGQPIRVLLDTGSSDLWVNFPGTVPTTTDLGKSLTLSYAIGAASGDINTAPLQFGSYSVTDQAFLNVLNASSFSSNIHAQGYDGLLGLGPNSGSQIYQKIDSDAGDSVLTRIFSSNQSSTNNFISFLLDRKGDPGQTFTGQFSISEYIPGFENISSMPQMDVETLLKLIDEDQHWQALTDKDNGIIGPDGQVIQYSSIVPKAPDGQLVVVFDSGFTFNQVPRTISDAIYGRVQGAVYDTTHQWWTVPCGQLLNVTINMGGNSYPVHPLDTVDNNFGITDAQGNPVCIGSFQPITTAFSLLGNYDMIMGMSFLRNTYTLMNYGKWANSNSNQDPFIQLLSVTNVQAAHNDFVTARLGGVDTTGAPQYALLPASQEQHSPVSEEEKKEQYEEMILSRWPYILVGCLVFVILVVAFIIWRCCCRKRRMAKKKAAEQAKEPNLDVVMGDRNASSVHMLETSPRFDNYPRHSHDTYGSMKHESYTHPYSGTGYGQA